MSSERILEQLTQEYAARREANAKRYQARVDEACQRCEGLRALLDQRQAAVSSGIRSTLLSQTRDGAQPSFAELMQRFNRQINALLERNGLPADYLQPLYTCPLCKDEGYVYAPAREMCDCLRQAYQTRLLDDMGLDTRNPQTFASFRTDIFSNEKQEGQPVSQRAMMLAVKDYCERYVREYPDRQSTVNDLLFYGGSGLGKTFLLQAVAHAFVDRGVGVRYTSAYRVLELARKAYFENNMGLMSALYQCPVLLIDDLGTEPLMENITVTQLFNLLNERQLAGRGTVVSTNLSMRELQGRYTERIVSRFSDKRYCAVFQLVGADVRRHFA